jgi:hypothetical protein
MVRISADSTKPMTDGYVFYNLGEKGMDSFPSKKSEITLVVAYIQIGFSAKDSNDEDYINNMCADQIYGLSPHTSWKQCILKAPHITHRCALRMIDVFDWGSKRLDFGNEWISYYDNESGWFCVGDPDFHGAENVNFIENAIAVLNETGELKALWIKPVFESLTN